MKNNSSKLMKAGIQSLVFFTMIFALLIDTQPESLSANIHAVTGALLLITSTVHLLSFRKWMKSVSSHIAKSQSLKPFLSWIFTVCMCIFGTVTGISGILRLINPIERIIRIHSISGCLLIILIGIHMLMHWNWLIANLRQLFSPRQNLINIHASERSSMGKK